MLGPGLGRGPVPNSFWGCGQLGTWDHIAWHCPDRPCRLLMPRYPVQARFGWVISGGELNLLIGWVKWLKKDLVCSATAAFAALLRCGLQSLGQPHLLKVLPFPNSWPLSWTF